VDTTGVERRRRRRHSAQFKAESVAACQQAGVSIAAVAMSRSLNANLLRRWVVEAERAESAPLALRSPRQTFVALPVQSTSGDSTPIRVEVRRGALTVSVQWPRSAMHECGMWLREVLK